MKSIIIYKGKYGATQQYANWLSASIGARAVSENECTVEEVMQADTIILGTSVYIGKLQLGNWIAEHEAILLTKRIFLYVVSGTPESQPEKRDSYVKNGVSKAILSRAQVFHLPGKMIYRQLSLKDKFLLRMGAMLSGKEVRKQMLTDYDDVREGNLAELKKEIVSSVVR